MHPILFDIGNFEISTWSVCVIIGVLLLIIFYLRDIRKLGVSEQLIDRIVIVGSIAGIFVYIGCSFFDSLWHAIDIANETGHFSFFDETGSLVGGVTFEGGIILGFIVWFILFPLGMKKDKKHSLYYMDKLVMYIFLGHAIGRLGCFFAGCCYGKTTTSILGMIYPTDLYGSVRVYPTQLIESFFLFIFFIIFKLKVTKNQTEKYLITYGIFRFFLEYLRGDNRGMVFGGIISPSQFMSIIFILGGIACIIVRHKLYYNEKNEYELLKEKYPEIVNNEAFKKQIDDLILKVNYDRKAYHEGRRNHLTDEEIANNYLKIDEVINLDNEAISPTIIKYYMDLEEEKENNHYELRRYFSLPEYIVIALLVLNLIYCVTEGIDENKTVENAIHNGAQKTIELKSLTDEEDIESYTYCYVKKSSVESVQDNRVYIRYYVKSINNYIYIEYNISSNTSVEINQEKYFRVNQIANDSHSYIKYGKDNF